MLATDVAVLAADVVTVDNMTLAVAVTIFAIVEEVEVVLVAMPFMPAMLTISIFAVVVFQYLDTHGVSEYQ